MGKDAVRAALDHEAVRTLPRGELFIYPDFLDRFFNAASGGYTGRLAAAARSLGLSLVGVDIEGGTSYPFLDSTECLEEYFLVGCLNGPFSRLVCAVRLHGGYAELPQSAGYSARGIRAGVCGEAAALAAKARKRGFSAIAVCDDIAGTQGLLFSPALFTQDLLPSYAAMAQVVREAGLDAFFHSDGETRKIILQLAQAGYSCMHPVDAQAGLDVYSLSAQFGKSACFMGHIDIAAWDDERIAAEVAAGGKRIHRRRSHTRVELRRVDGDCRASVRVVPTSSTASLYRCKHIASEKRKGMPRSFITRSERACWRGSTQYPSRRQ